MLARSGPEDATFRGRLVSYRERVGEGTRMTFEQFVATRLPALLRYAAVLTGDRDEARDLVQTVLAKAFASWGRVTRADRPEAYVHRMVTNEFLNSRRGRRPRLVELTREVVSGRQAPTVPTTPTRSVSAASCGSGCRRCRRGSARWSYCATTRACPTRRSPMCSAAPPAPSARTPRARWPPCASS